MNPHLEREINYFVRRLSASRLPRPGYFEPFKIVFKMAAPIALNHPWMHLDGLISHLSLIEMLGREYYLLPAKFPLGRVLKGIKSHRKLPLLKSGDLWHASVSILEPYTVKLDHIYKRFEDRWIPKTKKKRIYRGMGHFKDYVLSIPYIPAKTCTFYGVGDVEMIERILHNVVGLGNDIRIGYGAVHSFKIEPTESDYSIVKDGIAMRPIPMRYCEWAAEEVPLAWRPPYWAPENVELCAAPFAEVKLGSEMEKNIRVAR